MSGSVLILVVARDRQGCKDPNLVYLQSLALYMTFKACLDGNSGPLQSLMSYLDAVLVTHTLSVDVTGTGSEFLSYGCRDGSGERKGSRRWQ